MPELNRRLSDEEILHIFTQVTETPGDSFLNSYAEAICQAPRRDFYILRPASLILIAKYNLASHLGSSIEGARRQA